MLTLNCRFCNEPINNIFVDLGISPLSNAFLKKEMLNDTEIFFPLCVYVCDNCFLVQLPEFEKPENIFEDYAYFSSYSSTWLEHVENYVDMMIKKFNFNEKSTVTEIASNDGYLLQFFKEKNIPILGIEPAVNVAKVAKEKGIPTITKFFSVNTANELKKEGKLSDLIIGNNVLAHVPNINDFIEGMNILLNSDGIITMEFPHLMQLIEKNQFDTIYHEHFSYLSFHTVIQIFEKHNLKIFDVEELTTHGGSLRIYATHIENSTHVLSNKVKKLLDKEIKFGITDMSTYTNFQENVIKIKNQLLNFILSVKNEKKKIICYGAAAKGNTLLNYCGIGKESIEYVVDINSHKQGLYLPGSHLQIKKPEEIKKDEPDFILILPWNIKEEIMKDMSFIHEWNGKFVIPIPKVIII
jgi:2-polyprenyl-3-methyl-5-hydroxy-6-metoxy-1,4-benzoquinol methylase